MRQPLWSLGDSNLLRHSLISRLSIEWSIVDEAIARPRQAAWWGSGLRIDASGSCRQSLEARTGLPDQILTPLSRL